MKNYGSQLSLLALLCALSTPHVYAYDAGVINSYGTTLAPKSECNVALGGMANVGKISSDFGVGGFGDSIPLASIGKSVNLSGGCDVHVGRALFGMYANYGLGKSAFSSGDTSMSISPGYGVGARIGWMPKETWLVYMSGGLNWSNVKLKNNLMETENSTRGYKLGLGTEIQLTKPVWLRLEASGTRFDATNLNDGVNTTRVVPTMYGVGASIVYKF